MLGEMKNGIIKFDIKGVFGEEKVRVKELVDILLDAEFYEFNIYHSY